MKESWRSINWESIAVLSLYEHGTDAMQIARRTTFSDRNPVRPACGKFIQQYAAYREPAPRHRR
jgi:hypothetical protein